MNCRLSALLLAGCALGFLVAAVASSPGETQDTAEDTALRPLEVEPEPVKELAPSMGVLQRLTHKLALAAAAGNAELTQFYLFETIALLEETQREFPEYRGQPVALLIDRLAFPAYERFKEALLAETPPTTVRLRAGVEAIVATCNACHEATAHGFIHITPGFDTNPFNQSFAPRTAR